MLLGPPASGKGTQGRLMNERWRVPVVSAGDVLRGEIAADTALGREAARYMTDGGLVPDALALAFVLAQPWVGVALSGASTVSMLLSNLAALDVPFDEAVDARLANVVEPPDEYWERRSALPWN